VYSLQQQIRSSDQHHYRGSLMVGRNVHCAPQKRVTVFITITPVFVGGFFYTFCIVRNRNEHTEEHHLPCNRQHLSSSAWLEDKREDNQNCLVLCCVWQLYTMIRTRVSSSYIFPCYLGLDLISFCIYLGFVFLCGFHLSWGHLLVLFAFVVLGSLSWILSQETVG